jgi:hypothetical protein
MPAMTPRARFWLCLALVGVVYAGHIALKTTKIFAHPTWDAHDEVGQFWSEFAFHYRFAKFFAEHRDWSALSRDRSVQYPDSINDWAEFTVAMEVPVGVLYRWLHPRMPFHVFVVWYACLVSSLTVFGVFLLARALWRKDEAGVLAAVFYATLYPSYGRTVKNLFLREDFAIPLIVVALWATVRALQSAAAINPPLFCNNCYTKMGNSWGAQVGAAGAWVAALASWHLTQFVLAVGVAAAVIVFLGKGTTPRLPWWVLTLAAGSVAVPVLWAKQFFISPTMCALYALALAVWINGGRKRATLVFAGWLAGLVAVSLLLRQSYGEYAHVYQLFFAKLRHLGVKPADPAALTWEARCLWEGAFNTAGAGEFWRSLGWCLPLGLVGGWFAWRERDVPLRMTAVVAVVLVGLSWMVVRYFTFLGFIAAVLAAGVMTRAGGWRMAGVVAVGWQLAMLNWQPLDRAPVQPENYRPLVAWINAHTPTNAVLLGTVSESPVLLAYTGRPIILHSKFENRQIRERYREMLAAIYGSEEEFYRFAVRYGADYFVFDAGFLNTGIESRRYKADRLGELPADCAARLFAFAPERLRYFRQEFAANGYAIFRVISP